MQNNDLPKPSNLNVETPQLSIPVIKLSLIERIKSKKTAVIGILLTLIIVIIGFGFYYLNRLRTIRQYQSNNLARSESMQPTSITQSNKERVLTISYSPREKILETVKYQTGTDTEATSSEDWDLDTYDFYKVGTINSEKYRDGNLLLVLFKPGGPCKGPSCSKPIRLRYVKKDNVVTQLTKISYPISLTGPDNIININPFKKFGYNLAIDNQSSVPILEYSKEVIGNNPRQILKIPEFNSEEDGEFDPTKLYRVFTNSIYGDIYTTKAEFSPSKSFGLEGQGEAFGSGSGTDGCRDAGCFTTNQFFAFRPDGTFLKFSYRPDFSLKDISWTDNQKTGEEYVSYTVAGCNRQVLDDSSVVAPSLVSDDDLIPVGKTNITVNQIYGLKDPNHKLNTEFYASYKEYFSGQYIYPGELRQTKTFTEFIRSRPIYLWRDPFGRLIRFNNNEFLPPAACEPIIYLYPQTEQKITLNFDKIVNITDSTPEYRNGWDVIADPTGKIFNPSEKRIYPYLFWEGWSLIFPIQDKGFVIKGKEALTFFEGILPLLGLNPNETQDFIAAWIPQFSSSPYYFVTFLDQEAINKIAPIHITPTPDVVIRILMDIKPLDWPISVQSLIIPKAPQRYGFTVVEWGGLKR